MQNSISRPSKKAIHRIAALTAIGILTPLIFMTLLRGNSSSQLEAEPTTVQVVSQDLTVRYSANGVVQAGRRSNLSPTSEGQIVRLFVDEGDWVKAGQLVAQMSSQKLQAQVSQAESALAKAKAELAQKRSGSLPEEIAEAEARVDAAQASIAEAEAGMAQAQAEQQRNQALVAEGVISEKQFEESVIKVQEVEASVQAARSHLREQQESLARFRKGTRVEEIAQAEATVAEAIANLQYYNAQLAETRLYAPFSGTITRLFAQEGNFVTPTTAASASDSNPSTSIAELSSSMEIEAKIPEVTIAQIRVGQGVEIQTDAFPNEVFQGRVRSIAPRAVRENNVTSFAVKINLETGEELLKLGMNARLNILGKSIDRALVLPLATIVTQPNSKTGVYVLTADHQVQFRFITVGETVGDRIQVISGISEGEQVLISPPATEMAEREAIF
ncbi:efflux RND transporter periplasmic adaptor subunit [Phormidium tenue FACHB-886]|nr:efflux RND transporter periplasmic adaptor subunit [Phormidium tenue FACHB-886]